LGWQWLRLLVVLCGLLAAGCNGSRPEANRDATPPSADDPAEPDDVPADATKETPEGAFARMIEQGRQLTRDGKVDEARQLYQRLAAEYPGRYEPHHRLGILADRQQHFDEARQCYARAIRLRPDNAELYNDLGYSLFLQGNLEEAERELLKAVALAPANPRCHNNLGLVYGHLSRYEEAFEQFLHLGSEADAYYNLGYVLASRDNLAAARKCLEKALSLDAKHERAQKALAELAKIEGIPGSQSPPAPDAAARPPVQAALPGPQKRL
jgi:Flp pilus assembly protein TadD